MKLRVHNANGDTVNLIHEMDKVPLIGPWGARIGKAFEIWTTPCETTPMAFVKATWYAVPQMLISPVCPSATDAAIKRFSSHSHSTKRKFKWDVWDILEATGLSPPLPESGASWAFWKLGRWGAQALWYFALADAISEGVLNWTTLVYQYSGCETPYSQSCECEGAGNYVGGGIFGPGGFVWHPTTVRGITVAGRVFTIPHDKSWGCSWSLDFKPLPPFDPCYPDFFIRNVNTDQIVLTVPSKPFFGTNGSSVLFIPKGDVFQHDTTYEWGWDPNIVGAMEVVSGHFSVYVGQVAKAFRPGCIVK